ncbi:ABC transporter substrate binding protein [Thermodesulfatator autotrophicus]|uniref:ABC transporter substrate-binding protein n=1 Tax=Thermodesulfatator autotrophicus TaxID=1795632 RepID=A0A177E7G6_9BACT|nr:ABC transporter substrate binding protein [Thermodesulfatator autotrophicus]OAG27884.1 hypothetical protein TH606_04435 [Thermodesulfatator autotrophicus]
MSMVNKKNTNKIFITLIFLFIFSNNIKAEIIIYSPNKTYYKQAAELFLKKVKEQLKNEEIKILYNGFNEFNKNYFIVSLGGEYTQKVIKSNSNKIFFFMTADTTLFDLIERKKNSNYKIKIGGIFYIPEIEERIKIIKNIFNNKYTIAILYSDSSKIYSQKIYKIAQKYNIKTILVKTNRKNFLINMEKAFNAGNILWMIPDSNIYDQLSIKLTIINAVKRGIPVITFSPAFIESGAFMSYEIDNNRYIIEATKIFLDCYQKNICKIKFSKNFKIIINKNLAKFWNVKIKNSENIILKE